MNIRHFWFAIITVGIALIFTGCATLPSPASDASAATAAPQPLSFTYPGYSDGSLLLWEATKDDRTIYLLGSIHAGSPDMYPLNARIIETFAGSSALMVEVDLIASQAAQISGAIQDMSRLPQGIYLEDLIGDDEEEKLRSILDAYGLPYDSMRSFKPWVISSSLTLLALLELNMDPSFGIDAYLTAEAYDLDKTIIELESPTRQMEILDAAPLEVQLWDLQQTIDGFENIASDLEKLAVYWLSGDIASMEEEVIQPMLSSPQGRRYMENLLYQRNSAWIPLIEAASAEHPEALFVVVGSAHLLGTGSVIDLLLQQGYEIQRF